MKKACLVLVFLIILFVVSSGCVSDEKTVVKVVPAGSLLLPLAEIEQEYEALHPDIDIQIEGHGSIQAIRQVTDLHRPIDLIVVADESLIPDMMYREGPNGENYTDWYTPFARNEMVLAFTNESAYADEITTDNWYQILSRDDVRIGFSNPTLDAAGYRTFLVMMLAEEQLNAPGLFNTVIGDSFDPDLVVNKTADGMSVNLPVLLQPEENSKVSIRDASMFLLSLLESGGIDYAFDYKSVAIGQGLRYVELQPEVNLGEESYASVYDHATVYLGFQRFATIGNERIGMPIVYAATIPSDAPEREEAEKFLTFMLEAFAEGGVGYPAPL
ncbi:tungstate/molybdate binding protein [Methanocorpusculum labreanum Z]|uniref:Tungstate/molybdate binding protein n=1 Tax=Methanocorpusculum labreanum (strain ATCC 43576 / DSM 4855 / Z) TaxID=410358 RepID=A2SS88_METLZ|nr:tungstate ABC transporter substrate-binding protein WtpA [Methanocorpusculum labreanum]ABN07194.1 tungstate/molybdate binding protein [Methanocorpusculum labreanum Z]